MTRMAKGEGKAGCIFWILLSAFVALLAMRVIPAQVAKMQLRDHMKELAMTAPRKNGDWFEKQIMTRAKELDIPLEKKNLRVNKTTKRVVMDVEYTVVIDLLVTDYPMSMKIHLDRDIFLM